MSNINWSFITTGIMYILILSVVVVAGYLKVLPSDTTVTLFIGIVGSFLGLLVPSPLQSKNVTTLNRG